MNLEKINHFVVLMLENRSFDSMLGKLYPKSAAFDGLTGEETNFDLTGKPFKIASRPGTDKASMSVPSPDPGELFTDINEQLFGTSMAPMLSTAIMSGFVRNYLTQNDKPVSNYLGESIMHYYEPDQVPVISALAKQFAVCDTWHASAPCQTWPNRFFVHTGTANGYENNSPVHFPYEMPTIYNRLHDRNIEWKIYFHDMPQSMALAKLWPHADRFRLFEEFEHDANQGTLPAYSFIEPRYFPDVSLPNDQHPPHVITLGEQLIARIYNALRSGPNWSQTLLIVTYDEHGGCYDHVPPPAATPPSRVATQPFNFDRYGVRVPAVLVSPYINPGTILKPPGKTPFDHTSISKTLRMRYGIDQPLSDREAGAPDLSGVLNLASPTNFGPAQVNALPYVATPTEVAEAHTMPLNHMQQALADVAGHLPATTTRGDFGTFIAQHLEMLRQGVMATEAAANRDAVSALAFIKTRLGNLFRSI